MSRGPGKIQLELWRMILQRRKPMTVAEIGQYILKSVGFPSAAGYRLRKSAERSIRASLQRMVRDQVLITVGDGRPGNPFHYFPNPLFIILGEEDSEKAKALTDMFVTEAKKIEGRP
jgi:hypothetical protein